MITLGPYTFSENDTARVLEHAELLLDLTGEQRDATVLEPLRGAVGDVQRNRIHHGSPFQVLCIWSAEVIEP